APIVVAWRHCESTPSCRVVFQTPLGRLSAKSHHSKLPLEPGDRTGVAVLLEMARTWSTPRAHRVEIVLAATGGQAFDFAGARAMVRSLAARESRDIPTLRLLWLAPGIGKEVVIVSRSHRELAQSAARSLWIPHRLASRWFRRIDLWPPEQLNGDFVALIGAGYLKRFREQDVVNSATLHHAAQLATEIALRWIKRQQRGCPASDSAT